MYKRVGIQIEGKDKLKCCVYCTDIRARQEGENVGDARLEVLAERI